MLISAMRYLVERPNISAAVLRAHNASLAVNVHLNRTNMKARAGRLSL